MHRGRIPLGVILAAAVFVSVVSPTGGQPAAARTKGVGGRAQIICQLSHRNFDDAIVHPGQTDSTHEHGYAGSSDANGLSSVASMEAGVSSCRVPADTSGYWFPLLTSPVDQPCKTKLGGVLEPPSATAPEGQCVYMPARVLVYYNAPKGVTVNMVPEGLQMVAGGDTSNILVANYTCGDNKPLHPSPPHCTGKVGVVANIFFPSCIGPGGEQVYAAKLCPSGYLQIPNIHYDVRYAVGTGGTGWGVTSDVMKGMSDGRSLHADFWQTWSDQSVLAGIIARCDNTGANCQDVRA